VRFKVLIPASGHAIWEKFYLQLFSFCDSGLCDFSHSTPVVVDASNVSTVTIIQHGCQGLGAPRQCRRCLERGGKILPSGGLWTRELMPPPKMMIDMALLHSVSTGLIPFAA
jgi:hypothetical protein